MFLQVGEYYYYQLSPEGEEINATWDYPGASFRAIFHFMIGFASVFPWLLMDSRLKTEKFWVDRRGRQPRSVHEPGKHTKRNLCCMQGAAAF